MILRFGDLDLLIEPDIQHFLSAYISSVLSPSLSRNSSDQRGTTTGELPACHT
jgi:hypothetical protein